MTLKVFENYKGYRPPLDAVTAVTRLLRSVPSQYLVGLGAVVLTNAAGQTSKRTWRFRGEKWRAHESYGVYHHATRNEQPWIEVLVDNTIAEWPTTILRLRVLQEMVIASTLYHEIGHHIDAGVGGRREREATADEWSRKFRRIHFRREYWYLIPLVQPVRLILHTLIRLRNVMRRLGSPN